MKRLNAPFERSNFHLTYKGGFNYALYTRDKSNTKLIGKAITKGMGKVSGR